MACPTISGIIALIISWYKKNPDPNFQINFTNMIKLMYDLGGPEGDHIVQQGSYNIGVPKLQNFNPWKN